MNRYLKFKLTHSSSLDKGTAQRLVVVSRSNEKKCLNLYSLRPGVSQTSFHTLYSLLARTTAPGFFLSPTNQPANKPCHPTTTVTKRNGAISTASPQRKSGKRSETNSTLNAKPIVPVNIASAVTGAVDPNIFPAGQKCRQAFFDRVQTHEQWLMNRLLIPIGPGNGVRKNVIPPLWLKANYLQAGRLVEAIRQASSPRQLRRSVTTPETTRIQSEPIAPTKLASLTLSMLTSNPRRLNLGDGGLLPKTIHNTTGTHIQTTTHSSVVTFLPRLTPRGLQPIQPNFHPFATNSSPTSHLRSTGFSNMPKLEKREIPPRSGSQGRNPDHPGIVFRVCYLNALR